MHADVETTRLVFVAERVVGDKRVVFRVGDAFRWDVRPAEDEDEPRTSPSSVCSGSCKSTPYWPRFRRTSCMRSDATDSGCRRHRRDQGRAIRLDGPARVWSRAFGSRPRSENRLDADAYVLTIAGVIPVATYGPICAQACTKIDRAYRRLRWLVSNADVGWTRFPAGPDEPRRRL